VSDLITLPVMSFWEPWAFGILNLGKDVDPSEVLALLTTRWSFVEPVSAAAVDARDLADVAAVLEVFNAELLPLFSRLGGSRSSA